MYVSVRPTYIFLYVTLRNSIFHILINCIVTSFDWNRRLICDCVYKHDLYDVWSNISSVDVSIQVNMKSGISFLPREKNNTIIVYVGHVNKFAQCDRIWMISVKYWKKKINYFNLFYLHKQNPGVQKCVFKPIRILHRHTNTLDNIHTKACHAIDKTQK